MQGITGAFTRVAVAQSSIQAALKQDRGKSSLQRLIDGPALLEGNAAQLLQEDGLMLAFCGQPVWHESTQLPRSEGHEAITRILAAYRSSGVEALKYVRGHYSLALLDIKRGQCHLQTDRIGVHRLYWHRTVAGDLLFSSNLKRLVAMTGISPDISNDALYCYMYFHMVPTPYSIYRDYKKLPPGHCLSAVDGEVTVDTPRSIQFQESVASSTDLEIELESVLTSSVSAARQRNPSNAAFLSVGIDSSTIVTFMGRHGGNPPSTYAIGFDAKEYDETPFARISAKHARADHHEYFVTPQDVVDAVPKIAACYDEPFGNSSVVPSYYCAKAAADDGVALMLGGDGGDELFAGNERYAKQRQFQYYHQIPGLLRTYLLDALIFNLPDKLPLVNKARSYISQARIPLPERLQTYNFMNRQPMTEIFNDDFLASTDVHIPTQLQREVYDAPDLASDLNRMMFLDWRFTLADNDLRKVSAMCDLAGVEVAFPLLSDDLIDFSCRVPSSLKLKGGQLRYFFKHALRDILHPQTLTKSKHGFGLPFGVWLRDYKPLREMAFDSLQQLKARGYIKPSFIENALDMHHNQHAGYYGELIWIMMMLELWLQAHSQ